MIYKQIHIGFFLTFLLLILPIEMSAHNIDAEMTLTISDLPEPEMLAAEDEKEPFLTVTGSDNGSYDEWNMWFKGNGTYIYRLCTFWDGSRGGTPSTELFGQRGSVRGLKVGEQLQFYVASADGSVVGSDDNSAVTSPIGEGLCETVYKSPGGGYTKQDKPPGSPSELPPSAFASAWLTRTAAGAVLEIDGVPGARCGEESLYFNSTSPRIRITISNAELADWDRLEKTVSDSGPGMDGNGTYAYTVTVTARLPDLGGVEIIGCTELGVEEESVITAKTNKEGGTYRFWAEPQEMFSIESNGASASLRGSSPGRGTLFVEYTSADGKKTQTSQVATCVQVESYNNGQTIPQIAFYDIYGKKLDGIKKISVTSEPKDATDLLEIIPSDPGIVTAVWLGDEIDLKAQRIGITNLQATTNCGATTGPALEVEVVNCDDETNAKLAEMMRSAKEEQKRTAEEIEKILGSKEFEKAANEIAKSTYDLAEKTALLIISTSGATGAAKTVSDILSAAAALKDLVTSDNDMEKASNGLQILVAQLGSDAHQAVAGLTETISAAGKFGINLGTLLATNERLKTAAEVYEQANRQIESISGIQSICRKGTNPQPKQEQPPLETKKPISDPTPKPVPTPKPEITEPIEEPIVQEPQTEQPTADDEILVDPERPPVPPRQVGLPYGPDECGCEKSRALTPTSESFSTMQTGIENLQKCVDNFSNGPLTEYTKTLKEWTNVTEELGNAANSGQAELESAAKIAGPIIESLIVRTKSFDEAGKTFLKDFKKCPESLSTTTEVLKSVETITVDSIKTKY